VPREGERSMPSAKSMQPRRSDGDSLFFLFDIEYGALP
jgi:hypothetical protein